MKHISPTPDPLFPSKTSFIIFVSYISLFVSQGLLIKKYNSGKDDKTDRVVVILLTEALKLFICLTIYLFKNGGSIYILIYDIYRSRWLLGLYLVPAFLYCLYNNLTYINLEMFDLTTYYCLMQLRIVLTAIIYQILFKRTLTSTQWTSLFILTLGCLVKEYGFYQNLSSQQVINSTNSASNLNTMNIEIPHKQKDGENSINHFLLMTSMLMLQMFCSCFAGVYNEYLLKDSKSAMKADIVLQNIFMYLDSILCNLIVYGLAKSDIAYKSEGESSIIDHLITESSTLITTPLVLILILNNAMSGLVASFFLKSLNSILKTFASALELFAIALFAWMIFGQRIDMHTKGALIIVSASLIVYSRNPVSIAPPDKANERKDGFVLLTQREEED